MDKKFLIISVAIAVASLVTFHYITAYFVGGSIRTVANVTRVVDGDTLVLSSGEKVRLLGANSPEVGQYYHDEARDALKILVENKTIELEKDSVGKDKYGRLLRYVFIGDKFVNLGIVWNGYAHAYIVPPNNMYAGEFKAAEKHARDNQLGIWKHSEYFGCVNMTGFNYLDDNEFVQFANACNVSFSGWSVTDESSSHVYRFADTSGNVTLHSSQGSDNSTDLFWSNSPIWNNAGDTIFLHDAKGLLVFSYSYP